MSAGGLSAHHCVGRYKRPDFKQICQSQRRSPFPDGTLVISRCITFIAGDLLSVTGRDAQSPCAENDFFLLCSDS